MNNYNCNEWKTVSYKKKQVNIKQVNNNVNIKQVNNNVNKKQISTTPDSNESYERDFCTPLKYKCKKIEYFT